jgi:hypothetical protein
MVGNLVDDCAAHLLEHFVLRIRVPVTAPTETTATAAETTAAACAAIFADQAAEDLPALDPSG